MTSGRYGLVLREVGRLLGGGSTASLGSGPLLERFASGRDEAAFEALVARHGPMVLGTCRRMLSDPHDVDDAFQVTFLVLARKAGSIRDADRLGPWLHGVARRVAARSRALSTRRKARERSSEDEPVDESPNLLEGVEIREALDDELARLPEKYRAPLVLCYLERLTHDEAAEQLRWPVGTVRSRLAGGRDRLRARLTRRGLAPSAAVPAILTQASIPQSLLSTTVRVATSTGPPSTHLAYLMKGALIVMTWNQFKMVAAVGLMAGLTAGGVGVAHHGGSGKAAAEVRSKAGKVPESPEPEGRSLVERLGGAKQNEENIKHHLKFMEILHDQLMMYFNPPPEPGQVRASIEDINASTKALEIELATKTAAVKALTERVRDLREQSALAGKSPQLVAKETVPAPPESPPAARTKSRPGMDVMVDRPKMVTSEKTVTTTKAGAAPSVVPMRDDYILAIPGERDRVTAFNTKTGARATLRLHPGVAEIEAKFIGPNFSAVGGLALKGPSVRQIATFDLEGGAWYPRDLIEPATVADPLVGEKDVAYQVGRFIYVFGVPAKKWSVLELKRDPGQIFSMKDGRRDGKMIIPEGELIHIYDHNTGVWTHIDTKGEE